MFCLLTTTHTVSRAAVLHDLRSKTHKKIIYLGHYIKKQTRLDRMVKFRKGRYLIAFDGEIQDWRCRQRKRMSHGICGKRVNLRIEGFAYRHRAVVGSSCIWSLPEIHYCRYTPSTPSSSSVVYTYPGISCKPAHWEQSSHFTDISVIYVCMSLRNVRVWLELCNTAFKNNCNQRHLNTT